MAITIVEYGLDIKQIAKETSIDIVTLENLSKFTPHLSTIEKLAKYLEKVARARAQAQQA